MRLYTLKIPRFVTLVVVLALCSLALPDVGGLPAAAQGDFTPEQQAALKQVQEALASVQSFDTYTMALTQQMSQSMLMSDGNDEVRIVQRMVSEGSLVYQRSPEYAYDNRILDLTQHVLQEISGAGLTEETEISPTRLGMIVVEGQVFLQMETTSDLAPYFPQGWQDVTDGADMFPGMAMMNIQGMLGMGQALSVSYVDEYFDGVIGIEILEPEGVEGQTTTRYRILTDPAQLLEAVGPDIMAGMFNVNEMSGMDVEAFMVAMFESPETKYLLEVVLDGQGGLLMYSERTMTNTDVSAAFTDPDLAGVTVTLVQDIQQSYTLSDINEPVTITAPELAQ